MTQGQLNQYKSLDALFRNDCRKIVNILSNYAVFQKGDCISFATDFSLTYNGLQVCWEGEDEDGEYYKCKKWGRFPAEYLTMTEKELKAAAEKENNKYLEEKHRQRLEREKKIHDAEHAEYLKLKEKFENERGE